MTFPIIPPDPGGLLSTVWAQEIHAAVEDQEATVVGLSGTYRGEWVGVDSQTSDSGTTTTAELQIGSVTATLTEGYLYLVEADASFDCSGAFVAQATLREDSTSGTEMISGRELATNVDGVRGNVIPLVALYRAVATGSKTFVLTISTISGGGATSRREAGATWPQLITVTLASKVM